MRRSMGKVWMLLIGLLVVGYPAIVCATSGGATGLKKETRSSYRASVSYTEDVQSRSDEDVCSNSTSAADTITITYVPKFEQTEARSMLDYINEFRAGDEAWYWDEDDTTKVNLSGSLDNLTYDYKLEEIAMQRAAEIVVSFSSTRPNGESCFTAYTDTYDGDTREEVIAVVGDDDSVASAFEYLQGDNENYADQGSRRAMLSSDYTAVGIAHVVYNGIHYWVQELSDTESYALQTTALDTEREMSVEIATNTIVNQTVSFPENMTLTVGDSIELPEITMSFSTADTWSSSDLFTATAEPSCTVVDESIAAVSDGKIVAKTIGETTITFAAFGESKDVSVTVIIVGGESNFERGVDNNNFVHTNNETRDGAGFVEIEDYSMDEEYFEKLTANSDKSEKNKIKKEMNNEWEGSCYGIAMSMGLLYDNYIAISDLTDSKTAVNYHSMDYPSRDPKLRNTINYYQLSQFLNDGGYSDSAISKTFNPGPLYAKLKNWKLYEEDDKNSNDLPDFLRALVNYASQDHVELLAFSTSEGGHAVLVVGCEYDEDTEQYLVKIYDENSVDSSTSKGEFSYMKIAKDFSSFEYTDANGDKLTNSSYHSMYFLDWESLGNILPSSSAQSSNHARISFDLENTFKIVNDKGNYLEYDGNEFSGDMNIYDVDTVECGDGGRMIVETDNFSSAVFSNIKNGIDADIYNDDDYQSLSGENIESAEMIFGEGMNLVGQDFSFKVYLSTADISDDEAGLISVSANAKANVTLNVSDDKVNVTSSKTMTSIVSENLAETNVTETKHGKTSNLTVSSDDSAKDISKAKVVLGKKSYVYTGKSIKPKVKSVSLNGNILNKKTDYRISYKKNKNAGTAQVIITGKGNYYGSIKVKFKIKKATPTFKNTNKTLKYSKLKKKKQSFRVIKSSGGGKVTATYMKKGKISKKICKKYISVSQKGKVTVKKGAIKGVYKIKITVAKKKNYKKKSKIIYIRVK